MEYSDIQHFNIILNFFSTFCMSDFRMPLVTEFWWQNCSHYNLDNSILDLDKTWR